MWFIYIVSFRGGKAVVVCWLFECLGRYQHGRRDKLVCVVLGSRSNRQLSIRYYLSFYNNNSKPCLFVLFLALIAAWLLPCMHPVSSDIPPRTHLERAAVIDARRDTRTLFGSRWACRNARKTARVPSSSRPSTAGSAGAVTPRPTSTGFGKADCNKPCSGAKNGEICGGTWAMSVYQKEQ